MGDSRDTTALNAQPYRLFFTLGIVLSWFGVGQWALFALHLTQVWRVPFHAMVQVQAFIGCFVAGFLFTFIPRRMQTDGPSNGVLWLCASCPVGLTVFAWFERWAIAQTFWLLELVLLIQFVASRARRNKNPRPTPPTLVWIPAALLAGLLGSIVAAFPGGHALGKTVVLEGVVPALVLGVGSMLVPVIAYGAPAPDEQVARSSIWPQVMMVILFFGSFFLEKSRAVDALRLLLAGLVLVWTARLWRLPTQPEVHRWLVWAAAWMLPIGYAVVVVWPSSRSVAMHVIFIGNFSLMVLSVGHHVVTAHASTSGKSRPMAAVGALIAFALFARVMMALHVVWYAIWMSTAVFSFMAATLFWLLAAWPFISPKRSVA